mmetsp:Transcript_9045/g.15165  ORF Transcript_9045/g.15165 Transcript_9045/m.15165 type:complete len:82 (-) Transcript_9045:810-1055(-)
MEGPIRSKKIDIHNEEGEPQNFFPLNPNETTISVLVEGKGEIGYYAIQEGQEDGIQGDSVTCFVCLSVCVSVCVCLSVSVG